MQANGAIGAESYDKCTAVATYLGKRMFSGLSMAARLSLEASQKHGRSIASYGSQTLVQNQAADADKQDGANGVCPATCEFSEQATKHDT